MEVGPAKLVTTKGYNTSLAISTLRKLLGTAYLRRGDGIIATPESRVKERLFGKSGSGRITLGSSGVKHEVRAGDGYVAHADTCMKAFVRLLAEKAAPQN